MARQDPRYESPEEGKGTKLTYSIKACTAKMNYPDERLPRKLSMENFRKESAIKATKRNDLKTPLKASLNDFYIPVESWEQTAP